MVRVRAERSLGQGSLRAGIFDLGFMIGDLSAETSVEVESFAVGWAPKGTRGAGGGMWLGRRYPLLEAPSGRWIGSPPRVGSGLWPLSLRPRSLRGSGR